MPVAVVVYAVLVSAALVAIALQWRRALVELTSLNARFAPIVDADSELKRVQAEHTKTIATIAQEKLALEARRAELEKELENRRTSWEADFNHRRTTLDSEIGQKRTKWEADFRSAMVELERISKEVDLTTATAELQSFGFYKDHYTFESSEQYRNELQNVEASIEQVLKNKEAALCRTTWTVEGSAAKGRQMTDRTLKLQLRAFNGEADAAIARVKYNNATSMEERIRRAHTAINKLGETQQCEITAAYLELKLKELRLNHEYAEKVQAEREEQREIREQMRDEELAQKEIERAEKEAEKEETKYQAALAKAQAELQSANAKETDKLNSKIMELERKLVEAQNNKKALSMAQLTKSGYVYVISNIGAFGEHIYKVGMTRRLEPLERVRELGDASVPFHFDVHALIYAENAPELEHKIHAALDERRVNMVNSRKEFFRVTLKEIEALVHASHGVVDFTHTAAAEDYRKTVALIDELEAKKRNSLPPSPAKSVMADAKSEFDKLRGMLASA